MVLNMMEEYVYFSHSHDRYLYSRIISICVGDIQTVNNDRLVSWKGGFSNSHFLNMLYNILS